MKGRALLAMAALSLAWTNPVLREPCADPAVLETEGRYYLYTTTSGPAGFPIRVSDDLVHWTPAGAIFPPGQWPDWMKSDLWAPSVHRVGQEYLAYYTARDRSGRLCVGVARSPSPGGPFKDLGRPFIRDPRVGMIDPFLLDRDGRLYLYWKGDHNDLRPQEPTPIYVQELAADGLERLGEPREILRNDLEWEGALVEAPWVVQHQGRFYLFYSGNAFYDERYALGVARAESPMGPFIKRGEPILTSERQFLGPGHCAVLGDRVLYHAWEAGRVGPPHFRVLMMGSLEWDEHGWPRLTAGPLGI